jgi:hypothetical protein
MQCSRRRVMGLQGVGKWEPTLRRGGHAGRYPQTGVAKLEPTPMAGLEVILMGVGQWDRPRFLALIPFTVRR